VLAGGQSQGSQVTQWIVVVGQSALRRCLFDETAQQVVAEFECFFVDAEFLAVGGRQALDGEQAVGVVVGVILAGIGVAFGQQSADGIAFEFGLPLWSFSAFAVADFVDPCQMSAEVVAELASQVVDAFFFDQAIGGVVGELVRRVVFVDQRGQANGLVVFVTDALAFGVLAAAWQTASSAQ
jgi:hypothetical protein